MNSTLPRLPFKTARDFAEKIVGEIAPHCAQLEIAGSLRRERPEIGDVDLVCLPSDRAALMARVLASAPQVLKDGTQEFVAIFGGRIQLDLWFAVPPIVSLFDTAPTNFGSLLLCRTGSIGHNIFLVEHAKTLGLRWNPHWGVMTPDGHTVLASETEEQIFAALNLPFIPPPKRQR